MDTIEMYEKIENIVSSDKTSKGYKIVSNKRVGYICMTLSGYKHYIKIWNLKEVSICYGDIDNEWRISGKTLLKSELGEMDGETKIKVIKWLFGIMKRLEKEI